MYCVKKGGDRQALHEAIRRHSVDTAKQIKLNGAENDLLDRILNDPAFGLTKDELDTIVAPEKFIGRAKEQTEEFINEYAKPIIEANRELLGVEVSIKV
jgi:adenylosuccinate lyase